MRFACIVGLFSAISAFPSGAQNSDFISLDRPMAEIGKVANACPVRVELLLAKFLESKESVYRSGKAAGLNCEGAYIALITVEHHLAAQGLKPRIHPKVAIALPQGHDKLINIKYWLMRGDEVLSAGGEEISGDEGKVNSENGADLWYGIETEKSHSGLSLRIEAIFSDR